MTLPPTALRLFPDFETAVDCSPTEHSIIWERLLEDGTRDELRDWFEESDSNELIEWITSKADRLSVRSYSFWRWLLHPQTTLATRQANPYWSDGEV